MAFSHCENVSCFVGLSMVFYMLIRRSYYNSEGDATCSVLSESEIYVPNLKYCLFNEHIQFEENGSLGLYIIALLREKKEAEKKWQSQHFMSTAIISTKLRCLVHFPN